jgi:hypothetical protein
MLRSPPFTYQGDKEIINVSDEEKIPKESS